MTVASIVERERTVEGRDVRVLECDGGGPVVVLLHGLGLSASCWRPHMAALAAQGYRVIAPDLPGFGRSEGPRDGYDIGVTADWCDRFAAAEDLPPAAWVGHSHSCQILLRLARVHPERVTALALAAPTGQGHGMRRAAAQLIGLATDAFREEPRLVAGIVRRYMHAPIATIRTWIRARNHRPETDAAGVRVPVLVVLGEADPVVHVRYARRLARRLQDVRLRVIRGAAHAVALDPALEFSDLVAGFLRRSAGRSAVPRRGMPPEPPRRPAPAPRARTS